MTPPLSNTIASMIQKLPPTPSFGHRFVVGTVALVAGLYLLMDAGKDFEYIRFTPHSPEEIERRKKEHVGLQIKQLDTRTLDYTPDAKDRLNELFEQNKVDASNNEQLK